MSGHNVFRTHTTSKSLKRPKGRDPLTWWAGRPLSDAKNASATNTREQFQAAMKTGANWFEGSVKKDASGTRLEMREKNEAGGLSLDEWLAMGRASGRGLKLDVKEPQYMDQIVRQVKAAGIPSERLMWNLGDAAMSTWGAKLRQQFPRAVLAINPAGPDDKKISSVDVARLMSLAKRGAGGPVAFVIRYERLTDGAVKALRPYGNISVWSTQGKVSTEQVAQVAQQLRERGVDGVIDLQRAPSLVEEKVAYMPESSNPVARPRVVQ